MTSNCFLFPSKSFKKLLNSSLITGSISSREGLSHTYALCSVCYELVSDNLFASQLDVGTIGTGFSGHTAFPICCLWNLPLQILLREMDLFQAPFRFLRSLLCVFLSLLLHLTFFLFSTKITTLVLATGQMLFSWKANFLQLPFSYRVPGLACAKIIALKVKNYNNKNKNTVMENRVLMRY